MAVRNCAEIGENLHLIMSRLIANDDLVKLLYYTDKDPLSHDSLTAEQKKEEVFGKLIRIIPKVGQTEVSNAIVVLKVDNGITLSSNSEFKTVSITIDVFIPLTQWIIKNENLRPFLILGEIEKSLKNKTVNGLGKIAGGDFSISFITEEMACYEQTYEIVSYE